jgi:hypothetical protein
MTRFLVSSFFFFFATHVQDLACTKQICSLNVIIHGFA